MKTPETEKLFQQIRLKKVEEFCNHLNDADLNAINQEKQNLLHEAIAHKCPQICEFLIHSGIQVNHQDKAGQTPLHYVATFNQLDIARLIIRNNGDVSIQDKHGNTPLWCALFNARGKYEIVRLFLDAGGDPNHKNEHGRSPLDFAGQIADKKLIEMLSGSV